MRTPVSVVNQGSATDSRDQATLMEVSSSDCQATCVYFVSPLRFRNYNMNVLDCTLTALSLLNFDALHQAMSHLESARDVVRAMETCHSLHYAGVPILLRMPVRLDNVDRVPSFHQFMFGTKADKDRRFNNLRHFEFAHVLSFGVRSREEMSISLDRITEILQNSHNSSPFISMFLKRGY